MLYFLLWVVLFSLYLCAYSVSFMYVILLDWPPLDIIQCLVRVIDLSLSVLSPCTLCIVVRLYCILFLLVNMSTQDAAHVLSVFCLLFLVLFSFASIFLKNYLIRWLSISAAENISNTVEIINSICTNYLTLWHHCISKCGIRIL